MTSPTIILLLDTCDFLVPTDDGVKAWPPRWPPVESVAERRSVRPSCQENPGVPLDFLLGIRFPNCGMLPISPTVNAFWLGVRTAAVSMCALPRGLQ